MNEHELRHATRLSHAYLSVSCPCILAVVWSQIFLERWPAQQSGRRIFSTSHRNSAIGTKTTTDVEAD